MILVWFLVIIAVVLVIYVISIFNGLVRLKNRTKEAWSDIEVQLKRRYDLIPNLIKTVKGYASHEREVFEKVTETRANAISAQGVEDQQKAENMLTGALKSLFAVAENYPDLKASTNFLELQRELTDTEDKIEAARRFYNANVRDLNIKIESFPSNIVASMFGYKQMRLFEMEESQAEKAKEAPEINF
ncbi:MAG: LemA protein [Candidatus Berkelbacteria bacterium Licking1014_96]|uniref:LemA protein n=1 Tax=Candidatus Berkelbacteria bacterium Licking1014_96 TaxID=2017149 RepID=A0A554LCM2_9BACT|nr:MAG: LemA protein [Candidatus Berkelbacteria bacterium Licking1014_96]